MNESLFPAHLQRFSRDDVHWETYADRLTPVERVFAPSPFGRSTAGRFQPAGGVSVQFKRNDLFAPLGYGGVNGAKMMQMLWLIDRYFTQRISTTPFRPGLLYAGSVKSPQLARVAALAKHFDLPCTLVIGSDPQKAQKANPNVRIAAMLGASFVKAPAPYNPVLQKVSQDLHKTNSYRGFYLLEYGLSVEGPIGRIKDFYDFGARQVINIPDDVETLLVPAGSGNTAITVLTGLALYPPKHLRRVILFGVGPSRISWFEERIRLMDDARFVQPGGGAGQGVSVAGAYYRTYHSEPALAAMFNDNHRRPGESVLPADRLEALQDEVSGRPKKWELEYIDLHGTGFASYQDEMPRQVGHVPLYGTYEGKMWAYMEQHRERFEPLLTSGRTLFWIVGGAQNASVMAAADARERLGAPS